MNNLICMKNFYFPKKYFKWICGEFKKCEKSAGFCMLHHMYSDYRDETYVLFCYTPLYHFILRERIHCTHSS